jgi:NAD(P)-dependent dehydrogenase (short-subunit alcohol dehydrogenase family)
MSDEPALAFAGRSALVTGAGRGIGKAIALGLVAEGANVALLARSKVELDEVANLVRDRGGVALVIPADMGDADSVERAAELALSEFGTVDILVNNAGVVWPVASSTTIAIADWAATQAINVTGAVQLTFSLLPSMLGQGWGRVVNVSSGIAARPSGMIGANAYATSKAALEAHTLNLAAEIVNSGVAVNVYRPGGVDTAMQGWIRNQPAEQVGAALRGRFVESYQRGTLITPEESASSLLMRLPSEATGMIWDVRDAP